MNFLQVFKEHLPLFHPLTPTLARVDQHLSRQLPVTPLIFYAVHDIFQELIPAIPTPVIDSIAHEMSNFDLSYIQGVYHAT